MDSEDFSEFQLAGVPTLMLRVGGLNPTARMLFLAARPRWSSHKGVGKDCPALSKHVDRTSREKNHGSK